MKQTADSVLLDLTKSKLRENGFSISLSEAEQQQLSKIERTDVILTAVRNTKDLRHLLWSSIDNRESQDLDQVEYVSKEGDDIRLMVGIADVDEFITRGSPLDDNAYQNTTTIYTAVAIFPMLPEQVSAGKTSLLPKADKLVTVADILITPDGSVRSRNFYRAVVRNHARLVYEDVAIWLSEPSQNTFGWSNQICEQILLQWELSGRIQKLFKRLGALTFETVEARPLITNGNITIERVAPNVAREIIQRFMILVNNQVASFVEDCGSPMLYRTVRKPARWDRIRELASRVGEALPAVASAKALSDFLERRKQSDPAGYNELSLAILKLIGKGEYAVRPTDGENEGHFGLALEDYTHSTAPNRRYPDLVVQRLLKAALLSEAPPYQNESLQRIADHCMERERVARRIDRHIKKSTVAMYLQERMGETFVGIITGKKSKGTYIRLIDPPADGKVVRNEENIDVGDKVRVKLIDVDVEKGYLDFELI